MSETAAPFSYNKPHAIIGGFGVPGRHIAELLDQHQIPYRVIDINPATAQRVAPGGTTIIVGDMRQEEVLGRAGIQHARLVAITIPDETVVLQSLEVVRRLRPDVPVLARCAYTSAGMRAQQLGANKVVVAEQLVAREFFRLLEDVLRNSTDH